ncbi:hypothetical protein HUN01_00570 (plasmid) [Nostoc edaphicum CCNP1411]|uniref:Uncharacterized protein n=1 Tax=Nostoc edaphicum CCNP1411 TaxID=1472755 RepID=A0A7D7L8L7_9NOSO|nr:hypothetical protein [Nostoc edaphicum]QMS86158.1 hypothetical protein HUN01_00570 [Nostoc edaphicum CCNP1411]
MGLGQWQVSFYSRQYWTIVVLYLNTVQLSKFIVLRQAQGAVEAGVLRELITEA